DVLWTLVDLLHAIPLDRRARAGSRGAHASGIHFVAHRPEQRAALLRPGRERANQRVLRLQSALEIPRKRAPVAQLERGVDDDGSHGRVSGQELSRAVSVSVPEL